MPSPSVRTRKMYWRIGTQVRIARCLCSRCLNRKCPPHEGATGRIARIDRLKDLPHLRMPVIQLDNFKRLLWGYECYWTTERVHQQVMREHGGPSD